MDVVLCGDSRPRLSVERSSMVLFLTLRLTVESCHPDRSISFPKGMRCEVEGPAFSLHAKN